MLPTSLRSLWKTLLLKQTLVRPFEACSYTILYFPQRCTNIITAKSNAYTKTTMSTNVNPNADMSTITCMSANTNSNTNPNVNTSFHANASLIPV